MLLLLHSILFIAPTVAQPAPAPSPTSEISPPAPSFNATAVIQALTTVPITHYVANDTDLWVALQEVPFKDLNIIFTDNVQLKDPIWATTPTIRIPPGRIVEFKSPLNAFPDVSSNINAIPNAGGKILDFYNRTEVISVAENGTLSFEGMHVTGSPPVAKYLSEPFKATRPQPYGLATFPSVLCDPGCQIAHNYTLVDFYELNEDCSDAALNNIAFRAGIALNNASAAGLVKDASAVYLIGQGTFTFPVLDPTQGNITVGNANVLVNTTVRNCRTEAAAGTESAVDGSGSDGGGGLPAWAWALIGLAIAFAVITGIIGAFTILSRRKRRGKELLPVSNDNRGYSGGALTIGTGAAAVAAGGISVGGRGLPGTEDGRPLLYDSTSSRGQEGLLPAASLSANAMDVAAAAAMDIDVAALIQLRDAWRSRIGRVHGLDFQEAVGRGGFGTVFKSTWRGTQVAVKLVEHSVDSRITKQIQREAALATSCSHPNIVVTYKVATAGLGDLQKLPHYVEVSAAAAATATATAGEVELMPLGRTEASGSSGGGGGDGGDGAGTSKSTSDSTSGSTIKEDASKGSSQHTNSIAEAPASPPAAIVPGDLVATLIIMEYCDLGSMKDALYRERAYTLDTTPSNTTNNRDAVALLRTLIDVSLGLDYLHTAAGVVHGDLKPGNVLLKSSGNTKRGWIAKLGDFGVARALEGGLAQETTMGPAVRPGGTLAYMSPEMLESGILAPASDTYAFGILMWEGWTGLHPFGDQKSKSATTGASVGRGAGQAFLRAGSGERPSLLIPEVSGMPVAYSELMIRCWQQEMDARPAMAVVVLELRKILKEVLAGMDGKSIEANNIHFLHLLRVNK